MENQREEHLVWLATWVDYKGYDYETFIYCDNASNLTSEEIDKVWDYLDELKTDGSNAFYKKYRDEKGYKLF